MEAMHKIEIQSVRKFPEQGGAIHDMSLVPADMGDLRAGCIGPQTNHLTFHEIQAIRRNTLESTCSKQLHTEANAEQWFALLQDAFSQG
jgi:hypothetical protein